MADQLYNYFHGYNAYKCTNGATSSSGRIGDAALSLTRTIMLDPSLEGGLWMFRSRLSVLGFISYRAVRCSLEQSTQLASPGTSTTIYINNQHLAPLPPPQHFPTSFQTPPPLAPEPLRDLPSTDMPGRRPRHDPPMLTLRVRQAQEPADCAAPQLVVELSGCHDDGVAPSRMRNQILQSSWGGIAC